MQYQLCGRHRVEGSQFEAGSQAENARPYPKNNKSKRGLEALAHVGEPA
jgi:hypothetical protein